MKRKISNLVLKFFLKIFKIYLKIAFFLFNKFTLFKRRWQLRKESKKIEQQGGKVKIKNNEYLGGTKIIIEFPIKKKDVTD